MVSLTRYFLKCASLGFAVASVAFRGAVCKASPPYVIDVWTPYQGLPQSRVLSIAQTPDGYLWVGTKFGWLARFDGLRFVQFISDDTSAQGSSAGENEILGHITRKTRDMVRLIDEIVWAVNPKNDTLEQLVTYVCNFAEQYFRDSPTRCRIDVADDIPVHKLEADVRHHLFLIAKEALHNVAKHGATDRVWVRVNCDSGAFSLLIEDRGCGYDPASNEAGNGLANMRNRASLAGVDLTIESSPGNGTRVELLMKLKPESN